MRRPLVLLALALAGCTAGRHGAIDASRFVPLSDEELELRLGTYPNPGPSVSQNIVDGAGRVVPFPAARAHFADEVVDYRMGYPAPLPEGQDPRMALGPPDYTTNDRQLPRAVTLGNGGSLTLHFSSGALVDGDGPDLFIFEVGPSLEAMHVDVSADGQTWLSVGDARGGACAIDIHPFVEPGAAFHFVRLRDIPYQGAESDSWPGADIDAVAIVGSSRRVSLPGEVLFELDSDALSAGASAALDELVAGIEKLEGPRVTIEGHTDDLGTDEHNLDLSERRARAVADYLAKKGVARAAISSRGFGKTRPAASGTDEAARKKNRRVEIVIQGR